VAWRGAGGRDSKYPKGPILRFDPPEWRRFLDEVRRGTYDI
jgi:hypothetical protein